MMEHSRNVFCEDEEEVNCFNGDCMPTADALYQKWRKSGDNADRLLWLAQRDLEQKLMESLFKRDEPNDLDCHDGFVMVNGKCYPVDQVEDSVSREVYEEVGYYNEADLVPPITSSSYRVPKENKRRKMSKDAGPK